MVGLYKTDIIRLSYAGGYFPQRREGSKDHFASLLPLQLCVKLSVTR